MSTSTILRPTFQFRSAIFFFIYDLILYILYAITCWTYGSRECRVALNVVDVRHCAIRRAKSDALSRPYTLLFRSLARSLALARVIDTTKRAGTAGNNDAATDREICADSTAIAAHRRPPRIPQVRASGDSSPACGVDLSLNVAVRVGLTLRFFSWICYYFSPLLSVFCESWYSTSFVDINILSYNNHNFSLYLTRSSGVDLS